MKRKTRKRKEITLFLPFFMNTTLLHSHYTLPHCSLPRLAPHMNQACAWRRSPLSILLLKFAPLLQLLEGEGDR